MNETNSVKDDISSMIETQRALLLVMISTEERASELYLCYSHQFPEDEAFWLKLSKEETVHANMLSSLDALYKQGSYIRQFDPFTKEQALGTRNKIDAQLSHARQNCVTRCEAFATAIGIESSLVERGFFGNVVSDDSTFERISTVMMQHCVQHRESLHRYSQSVMDNGECDDN